MPASFVTTAGTAFALDGARFPVNGVNCYFLAYCGDTSRRAAIAVARQMGANVIRCWAFLAIDNYSPGTLAFQYFRDGAIVINDGPDGLQRLDALIKAAEDAGVKLILPLVNHWDTALGGMPSYVKWLGPDPDPKTLDVTDFYRLDIIKNAYKTWLQAILTRRNSITGRLYSDEPAIMAWELTNEARCQTKGGRELLLSWIAEMAAFVKQHDSHHLLALGDEGMFYKQGSGDLYDGSHGVDWVANLAVAGIDFGTFHFYPQQWKKDLHFATRWIHDHAAAAQRLNKPALMEEFGLKIDGTVIKIAADRDPWFTNWLNTVQSEKGAGQLLWMLGYAAAADTKDFVDEYVIYSPEEVPCLALLNNRGRAATSQENSA
jgi:mannan endo-1,4-beta-mannosidase